MSTNEQRDIMEILRDIQEDIRGDPNRGIDGVIPKLDKVRDKQKEHEQRLQDVEGFVQAIQGLPDSSKKVLRWLGLFAGLILSILGVWKWLQGS